eukprot:2088097-Amphidinium_carterae.1
MSALRIAETLSTLSAAGGDDVDFPVDRNAARIFGRRLAQAPRNGDGEPPTQSQTVLSLKFGFRVKFGRT